MSCHTQVFIVNNIKLPINASHEEAFLIAKRKLLHLGIKSDNATFSIYKRSVDARQKSNILFVYSIRVSGINSKLSKEKLSESGITVLSEEATISFDKGDSCLNAPPLIVGAGPSGLFAALLLAENGYNPIIVERGGSIEERTLSVSRFINEKILDTESNIQFGAGGAGTFSDGKLITRINDPFVSYVLSKFVQFGAPKEILYLAKPHIGTDVLSQVIKNMISYILSLGAKILYNTRYISSRGSIAVTSCGEIEYGVLILAIGHSSRDTYETIINDGYAVEAKNFSVGMRIEHLAKDIDEAMYGDFAGNEVLGHAEYALSHDTKNRGVYTFCMCPGGVVVPAASETETVVVNGMSYHSRSNLNSNSAVVCSVFKEDYRSSPLDAINFQRNIEKAAFIAAGSNYSAPIITVGDLLNDKLCSLPTKVIPSYMNGTAVTLTSPNKYLPDYIVKSIKNALTSFDKKIQGFANPNAVLTGPETRTSAPIRILRDENTRVALGKERVYPCGEGAGYAGGITSAAVDGIKTAIAIMSTYQPK